MAKRIAWWVYVLCAAIGLVAGVGMAWMSERHGSNMIAAPWIVSVLMVVLGLVVLYLAIQVHKYTTTDPKKRATLRTFIDPDKAVNTLVLAKALVVAGALLVGWYAGQACMLWKHWEIGYYRDLMIECGVAAVAALFDMIIGMISEWLCQLPPNEGPEHPHVKANQSRHRPYVATKDGR